MACRGCLAPVMPDNIIRPSRSAGTVCQSFLAYLEREREVFVWSGVILLLLTDDLIVKSLPYTALRALYCSSRPLRSSDTRRCCCCCDYNDPFTPTTNPLDLVYLYPAGFADATVSRDCNNPFTSTCKSTGSRVCQSVSSRPNPALVGNLLSYTNETPQAMTFTNKSTCTDYDALRSVMENPGYFRWRRIPKVLQRWACNDHTHTHDAAALYCTHYYYPGHSGSSTFSTAPRTLSADSTDRQCAPPPTAFSHPSRGRPADHDTRRCRLCERGRKEKGARESRAGGRLNCADITTTTTTATLRQSVVTATPAGLRQRRDPGRG
ncbi:hypothetical protein BaRGS_00034833 [Batillaria attramentaria]|uniref:Uncharacterized protein n=1 Tax=Batillaria attramentaria TaxID=370345 RepID=A0ABD0JGJ4_9CAEN